MAPTASSQRRRRTEHHVSAYGTVRAQLAMDPFFQDAIVVDGDDDYLTILSGMILPPAEGSAFAPYQHGTSLEPLVMSRRGRYSSGGGANVHRRMFGYLRRISDAAAAAASTGNVEVGAHPEPADGNSVMTQAPRGSPRFRHIMRERLRRERLSQGFADLHALLPSGASKGGKNDIVGAAAGYIRELEGRKQWLCATNEELLEQAARTARSGMVVKVRAEGEQHSVAVDVFETVLRRLKAMEELRVTRIRSCFGDGGMWMNVGVECEVSAYDVDKAITNALAELEENAFGMQVPRSSRPAFSCQVERGVPMC